VRYRTAAAGVLMLGLLLATPAAFAGGKGGGSSLSLVQLGGAAAASGASTDPWFGEQVTFDVHTSSTTPTVVAECYQDKTLVYAESHGFWDGSMFGTIFTLGPTDRWSGGAADCSARLVDYSRGKNGQTLATTTFHVTG
jgi:hypothetical protein